MIKTAQVAVKQIRPGQRIFIGSGCGQPQALVEALLQRAVDLEGSEIIHMITTGEAPYLHKELAKYFRINSFFIAGDFHDGPSMSLSDYTPMFLSDIPQQFHSGRLPLDVALIQVTPPNEQGRCSLGISVDIVRSAAENAGLVIAQVNGLMPWTMGDSAVYTHDFDSLVPADRDLLEDKRAVPIETTHQIAENIAALIEDGSTLGLGHERISQAVLENLGQKRDLGLHTEVISDAVIGLVESGVISGVRKNIDQGRIVASTCMGTRKLYDFVDQNPLFSFRPIEYVCNPQLISQHNRMVAICIGLEVDLTGQISANSLESKYFSGISNHMDFAHGAVQSPGGKLIVALDSTRSNGAISRIVSQLSHGAGVSATRWEVHYVVTEYGVAYLHGKSLQDRAMSLISIAHPDFREVLLKEAIKGHYVRSDLAEYEGKILVSPQELRTSMVLDDGTQVNFRPMHPTDEKPTRYLFDNLSQDTIYYRFMSHLTRVPQKQIQNFVYIDYRGDMAIVGTLPEAHGEDIIAVGRYYLDPRTNRAEVAFTVHDKWQRRGIGTFLLNYLITIAKQNGIAGFTAEVLSDNKAMLSVFHKSNCKISSEMEEGLCSLVLEFV
ncbi:MAG: GNAT family N-acetyltransferase [Planctomycetes bacterium]|nr:GNAT family N-acetyltransferase [Planctomycetota bacterium]